MKNITLILAVLSTFIMTGCDEISDYAAKFAGSISEETSTTEGEVATEDEAAVEGEAAAEGEAVAVEEVAK